MKRSLLGLFVVLILAAGLAVLAWQWAGDRGVNWFAERFGPAATPTSAPTAVVAAPPTPSATPPPTPIPPTPTPAALWATLDPALNPDRVPAAGPLTVRFPEPVNAEEVLRPLSFSPNLPGVFTWNDDHTAATFVPSTGFRPGATYRVIASTNLRGVSGATFDGLPSWKITIAGAPRVLRRQPALSNDDDRQPTFRLTFSAPMARDTVTATVKPAVPLEQGWDGDAYTIRPTELLDPGVRYTFTVGEGATDDAGTPLRGPESFSYTPYPTIRRVDGPTPTSPNAPLTISFGYPMHPDAAEALVVEPSLEGEWRWVNENTLALDEPSLLGNIDYAFSLSRDVQDAAGNPLPAPAEPVTFTAPTPVAISPAGTGAHPGSVLRLVFTRPVTRDTVAAALTIAPEIAGDVTWENETTLLFTPVGGYWQPQTKYTVTLDATATDAGGHPLLGAPLAHTFTTGAANSLADWGMGPQIQVLDADGRRAVQLQVEQPQSVTLNFDLLPLTQEGFLNRLVGEVVSGWEEPVLIPDDGLAPIASWTTQTIPADPEMWNNAQETLLPADAPVGLYLLRLAGEPRDANLLLALTRMTLVAKQADGQLVVWVTDIDSRGASGADPAADPTQGAPVPGAAVQVYARNGRLLAEGLTDERGIVRLALPAEDLDDDEAAPYVVFARAGDDVTFSGLTNELQSRGPYYDWGWWSGAPAAMTPPAFAVHIQTDRPLYRPGHTVHYKAIVRLEDDGAVILPPEGTQVIVRLRDARNNVVRTQWLGTDAFGAVYDSFDVAEGAMLGTYAIEVQPVAPGGGAAESHRQT
ncbi:Ig-like domain-containing protein, partial [Promineifilum sp.]|uniref:Ig-like domain-containing alpha-2-macroglobulin family protein n=1 Tax=Promineifilum sp. TaxID=2664178 RepID=UPI0035AFA4CE